MMIICSQSIDDVSLLRSPVNNIPYSNQLFFSALYFTTKMMSTQNMPKMITFTYKQFLQHKMVLTVLFLIQETHYMYCLNETGSIRIRYV